MDRFFEYLSKNYLGMFALSITVCAAYAFGLCLYIGLHFMALFSLQDYFAHFVSATPLIVAYLFPFFGQIKSTLLFDNENVTFNPFKVAFYGAGMRIKAFILRKEIIRSDYVEFIYSIRFISMMILYVGTVSIIVSFFALFASITFIPFAFAAIVFIVLSFFSSANVIRRSTQRAIVLLVLLFALIFSGFAAALSRGHNTANTAVVETEKTATACNVISVGSYGVICLGQKGVIYFEKSKIVNITMQGGLYKSLSLHRIFCDSGAVRFWC